MVAGCFVILTKLFHQNEISSKTLAVENDCVGSVEMFRVFVKVTKGTQEYRRSFSENFLDCLSQQSFRKKKF